MQCSCGEEVRSQKHEVKTLDKAIEWYLGATKPDLPIQVEQDKCPSCGRMRRSIYSKGIMVFQKG